MVYIIYIIYIITFWNKPNRPQLYSRHDHTVLYHGVFIKSNEKAHYKPVLSI